jgi:hypothetical protein
MVLRLETRVLRGKRRARSGRSEDTKSGGTEAPKGGRSLKIVIGQGPEKVLNVGDQGA